MNFSVKNLINNNGNCAANQFVIKTKDATYFQSYNSIICKIQNGKVSVSKDWDYSKTTTKHLYIFLRDYGYDNLCSAREMRKAIEENRVTRVDVLDVV